MPGLKYRELKTSKSQIKRIKIDDFTFTLEKGDKRGLFVAMIHGTEIGDMHKTKSGKWSYCAQRTSDGDDAFTGRRYAETMTAAFISICRASIRDRL